MDAPLPCFFLIQHVVAGRKMPGRTAGVLGVLLLVVSATAAGLGGPGFLAMRVLFFFHQRHI